MFTEIGFGAVSIVSILSAVMTLEAKDIVRGLFSLSIFFCAIAALFALQGAVFLAIGQLLLFLGGFLVLLVIGFEMTELDVLMHLKYKKPIIVVAACIVLGGLLAYLSPRGSFGFKTLALSSISSSLFEEYGILLVLAFFVLLSSLVTAVYFLEKKGKPE